MNRKNKILSFFLFLTLFLSVIPVTFVKCDNIQPTLFWSATTDYGFPAYSPDRKIIVYQMNDGIHVFWASGNNLYERLPSGTIATRYSASATIYAIFPHTNKILMVCNNGFRYYNVETGQTTTLTTFNNLGAECGIQGLADNTYLGFFTSGGNGIYAVLYRWSGTAVSTNSYAGSGTGQGLFVTYIWHGADKTTAYAFACILFTDTNTYLMLVKLSDGSATTYTSTTGVTLNRNYPLRVIRSDLSYDVTTGAYSGAVTVMGAPTSGGAARIVNIFFSGGASFSVQTIDIPNPQGAVGNGMGAVWAYKTNANQYGISFYKSLYSDKYKYTITLSYNNNYQIISASASQVSDPNYPVLINPNWIYETYLTTLSTTGIEYYKEMYGWSNYIDGSVRVEWTTYPSNQLNMYSLTRIQASGGEQGGGGVGQSGSVTRYQTITNNTYYYFKLGFPSSSDIKIMSLGVDLNVTGVNSTYPLTIKWLIFNGNTLKYTYITNITTSTTVKVTINPEIMVGNGNLRLGIVPITYTSDTVVQLGYGVPNVETYYKPYTDNIDFTQEGYLWSYRASFSYTYQDLGTGVGTGGQTGGGVVTVSNGSYTYSYNGTTPWSGQTITTPSTVVGNSIRNAFITWGYGDIGGIAVFLIITFGLMLAFARFGLGSEALIPAFGIGGVTTFYLGLIDITVFAVIILILITLAGYKVFLR
jgi:hypothetical protein